MAELAGVMHDLAQYFATQVLWHQAGSEGLEIDSVFEASPPWLHLEIEPIVA
jgi:HD superfamily phosphohydrolase YqeK